MCVPIHAEKYVNRKKKKISMSDKLKYVNLRISLSVYVYFTYKYVPAVSSCSGVLNPCIAERWNLLISKLLVLLIRGSQNMRSRVLEAA